MNQLTVLLQPHQADIVYYDPATHLLRTDRGSLGKVTLEGPFTTKCWGGDYHFLYSDLLRSKAVVSQQPFRGWDVLSGVIGIVTAASEQQLGEQMVPQGAITHVLWGFASEEAHFSAEIQNGVLVLPELGVGAFLRTSKLEQLYVPFTISQICGQDDRGIEVGFPFA